MRLSPAPVRVDRIRLTRFVRAYGPLIAQEDGTREMFAGPAQAMARVFLNLSEYWEPAEGTAISLPRRGGSENTEVRGARQLSAWHPAFAMSPQPTLLGHLIRNALEHMRNNVAMRRCVRTVGTGWN